jgi:UDP-GlcNAc3NAcA epimerase
LVIVYGDTNSTLGGALAASKLSLPLAHIEAGMRSFNPCMAEEINRVVTDHLADMLFTPTANAKNNLLREGVKKDKIFPVGDIMYDAALYYGERTQCRSNIFKKIRVIPKGYILCTVHRAENTDNPKRLKVIFSGLNMVARKVPVIMPLHPRTRSALHKNGISRAYYDKIILIEPVGYLDMLMLEKNSRLVVTDSGGLQKEAFFFKVSCITLREQTEWVELVESGWNKLVPPVDPLKIAETIVSSLDMKGRSIKPYGNGNTGLKITSKIKVFLEEGKVY